MDLYIVYTADSNRRCFAFDVKGNWAKMRVAKRFGEDYLNMRCKTLAKGFRNIYFPMIVACPEDEGYELVQQLGFSFGTDDER